MKVTPTSVIPSCLKSHCRFVAVVGLITAFNASSPGQSPTPKPDPIVGRWRWHWAGQSDIVETVHADGTEVDANGTTGTWKSIPSDSDEQKYLFQWNDKGSNSEEVIISIDGKRIDPIKKTIKRRNWAERIE